MISSLVNVKITKFKLSWLYLISKKKNHCLVEQPSFVNKFILVICSLPNTQSKQSIYLWGDNSNWASHSLVGYADIIIKNKLGEKNDRALKGDKK